MIFHNKLKKISGISALSLYLSILCKIMGHDDKEREREFRRGKAKNFIIVS